MNDSPYIDKSERLPEGEDFALLRKQGIEYLQRTGSQLWTDHNVHDPGITTLEVLCYALTDLAYRTGYPIEDILAETPLPHTQKSQTEKDATKTTEARDFFTARQILPCNPVTANDFRALMIDVPGVKNAWLEPRDRTKPQLYVDCSASALTLTPGFRVSAKSLVRLDEIGVPHGVRQALENLLGHEYRDEESFLDHLKTYLDSEFVQLHQDDILLHSAFVGVNRKIEPVHLRGLYDVLLELETDAAVGDLNRYIFEVSVENEEGTFSVDVVLPAWDAYFTELRDEIGIEEVAFGPLSPGRQSGRYEGLLTVRLTTNQFLTKPYHVVLRSRRAAVVPEGIERAAAALRESYRIRLERALSVVREVYHTLHCHRSLCEDFCQFRAIAIDDIMVCADVEVDTSADAEMVMAQIFDRIAQLLSPSVRFYTLEELMDKKHPDGRPRTVDEIFEGPALRHGFIDPAELEASELVQTIHVSDVIQEIMDVKGVNAVKKILLTDVYAGVPQTSGEPWCLTVGQGHAPRLHVKWSQIRLFHGVIPRYVDEDKVLAEFAELRGLDRHRRLSQEDYDIAPPAGQSRNVQRYYSFQHDYPLCYGVGDEGLGRTATTLRKAQAKQFKAYLLLYDRLLADYLAQLAHVKDLFSLDPDVHKTYFSQLLCRVPGISDSDVPGLAPLLKEFVESLDLDGHSDRDIDDPATYKDAWDAKVTKYGKQFCERIHELEEILEDQRTYEDRENRLLDHLLSRFCEQFTDYAMLMCSPDRSRTPAELIDDKHRFLKDYPQISRDRGRAFNQKPDPNVDDPLWESHNTSGYQKRVARLLGITSCEDKRLAGCIDNVIKILDDLRFDIVDSQKTTVLTSAKAYENREDVAEAAYAVAYRACLQESYRIEPTSNEKFQVCLLGSDGRPIARSPGEFDTRENARNEVGRIASIVRQADAGCEGFHVIEHLLLRPQEGDDEFFPVCVGEDCCTCSGVIDPYSFRMTIVIPYWPYRFRSMESRRFFEATFREQAPAHVHVKICWVDRDDMRDFEDAYYPWRSENAPRTPDPVRLSERRLGLVRAMSKLRSVYPQSRLHEYVEGQKKTPLLLDHSVLGSTKEDQ